METIYHAEYPEIVNRFAKEILGLKHTEFTTDNGDLGKNWIWNQANAYIAAGGLKSNIDDMLAYAQMQLDPENQLFSLMHEPLREINAASESYQKMGIRMDEIGSLTKTFTAAMFAQAYLENRIPLGDSQTIAGYLGIPENETYPTIEELLTHTSGYKGWYFESPMVLNYLTNGNIYHGITDEMIVDRVVNTTASAETYPYEYSNFGYAVLGKVIETIYHAEYPEIVNRFAKEVLGLKHTEFTMENGDLGNYWTWNESDAYIAAGGLKSDIEDMLAYAQMQLDPENQLFSLMHEPLREINASSESYQKMGIRMDEIGMAWIIDSEHGFVWHNGGTDDYNCYLGFCPETQTAVVILSNLPPSYRIPATVMGVKLLEEIQE